MGTMKMHASHGNDEDACTTWERWRCMHHMGTMKMHASHGNDEDAYITWEQWRCIHHMGTMKMHASHGNFRCLLDVRCVQFVWLGLVSVKPSTLSNRGKDTTERAEKGECSVLYYFRSWPDLVCTDAGTKELDGDNKVSEPRHTLAHTHMHTLYIIESDNRI